MNRGTKDEEREERIHMEDWHYWVDRGYEL
jgi:hypothetical protein